MGAFSLITDTERRVPRVIVVGLASCFGCQLQITNAEPYLTQILGQIDLQYWQLVTSEEIPDEFDVAIIEGAVTTRESEEIVKAVRGRAAHVMSIGACATTAGVTGMAAPGLEGRIGQVYDGGLPDSSGLLVTPRPVSAVIEVDSEVRCCPIDPMDFVATLQRALFGSNRLPDTRTLCSDCKRNETECFYNDATLCLGLVTRAGCGARCVNLGRPCTGCAGLSPDANVEAARMACATYGVEVAAFDKALEMFNQVNPALAESGDA